MSRWGKRGEATARASREGTLEAVTRAGAFDAVVVGAGATGGLAALLLAEAGMSVLVLEAGLPRTPLQEFRRSVFLRVGGDAALAWQRRRQPVQSLCYAWPLDPYAFVDDRALPYETPEGKPFAWFRSRQLGGRLTVPGHGRQYYRMGPQDLDPGDGESPAWPIEYAELAPWYAAVERRLGMAGGRDGIPWLPDSEIAELLPLAESERRLRSAIGEQWPEAPVVVGRFAAPADFLEQGARAGRVTIREGAIARELDVDSGGRIRAVRWLDQRTRRIESVSAPLVFLCASTLESTRLLLLSRNANSPGGIGAGSGALGANLMDHVRLVLRGNGPHLPVSPVVQGRCLYLPRFDARRSQGPPSGRGFGVQVNHGTGTRVGKTGFSITSYGEMLPRSENRVTLHPTLRDAWGIPALRIDCAHGAADLAMAKRQREALLQLAETFQLKVTHLDDRPLPPGSANHECGTARMGRSPVDSVLDPNNECWEARGLYLADGASLPSQGTQNPTLTYLALTARACAHAIRGGTTT